MAEERIGVDELLARQAASGSGEPAPPEDPLVVLEGIEQQDEYVIVTPYSAAVGRPVGDGLVLPKAAIASLVPTGAGCGCCGDQRLVVQAHFADATVAAIFRQLARSGGGAAGAGTGTGAAGTGAPGGEPRPRAGAAGRMRPGVRFVSDFGGVRAEPFWDPRHLATGVAIDFATGMPLPPTFPGDEAGASGACIQAYRNCRDAAHGDPDLLCLCMRELMRCTGQPIPDCPPAVPV